MRHLTFSAEVHAPFETIWKLLLDRIEHPQEYFPGAESARIIERQGDELIREVKAQGVALREKVAIDRNAFEIRYTLLQHPLFSGTVTYRAVPFARQSPVSPVQLTMVVDWVPKNEEAEQTVLQNMSSEIQQEVLSLKEEAEALAGK
ncbi:MAG: SRPBCC family protein [Geobacter sp.]|nr:SRPBCC family protein [Geobacter sp.]